MHFRTVDTWLVLSAAFGLWACSNGRGSEGSFGASSAGGSGGSGPSGSGPSGSGSAGTEGNNDGEAGEGGSPGSNPSDDGNGDGGEDEGGSGIRFDLSSNDPTSGDIPGEHRTCGEGEFVFEVPYQLHPNPSRGTIDCAGGSVTQADIVFSLDTTDSMQRVIDGARASLGQIVHDLGTQIPDIAFGVGGFDDFPDCGGSGTPGDVPWYLVHRVMTVSTPQGVASVDAALGTMRAENGGDGPESGYQALHEIATGQGIVGGGANVPPFNPATAPPMPPVAGETVGNIGGVGFREGSLPIVVMATDTRNHNCEPWPINAYSCGVAAATCDQAIGELVEIGARVIALMPGIPDGTPPQFVSLFEAELAEIHEELKYVVMPTGGAVLPSAWSIGGAPRPAGCAPDQCCTLEGGAGRAPEPSGECPLVFRMGSDWMGLGDSVATAIKVLAKGGSFDIGAKIEDDPSDDVDAVAEFVDYIETSSSNTAPCTSGHMTADGNGDGRDDRFINLTTGESVCFDLIPKTNVTVPAMKDEQRFKAYLDIQGSDVTSLGRIEVTFVVPPAITPE